MVAYIHYKCFVFGVVLFSWSVRKSQVVNRKQGLTCECIDFLRDPMIVEDKSLKEGEKYQRKGGTIVIFLIL